MVWQGRTQLCFSCLDGLPLCGKGQVISDPGTGGEAAHTEFWAGSQAQPAVSLRTGELGWTLPAVAHCVLLSPGLQWMAKLFQDTPGVYQPTQGQEGRGGQESAAGG